MRPGRTLAAAAAVGLAVAAGPARAGDDGAPSASASAACAGNRYAVRNLLDAAAEDVSLRPQATTVARLRALRAPRRVTNATPRLRPVEYRTYRLRAPLVAGRRLPGGDILLVLGTERAPIHVAFPDTHSCEDIVTGILGQDIHVASDQVENLCGVMPTDRWRRLRGRADLTGVGFFAVPRADVQPGAAPTGIELHPALSFTTSSCRGAPGAFPAGG